MKKKHDKTSTIYSTGASASTRKTPAYFFFKRKKKNFGGLRPRACDRLPCRRRSPQDHAPGCVQSEPDKNYRHAHTIGQGTGAMADVRLGDWDSLPIELAVRILNGHCGADDDDDEMYHGDPVRPFLDPRWRFAARAVSRQWRTVIEHPTPAETMAMGVHPHKRWNVVHKVAPFGCPKWPTGRVVCLTALAEWIASDASPWTADPEAFYVWCARTCGATRKHVVAVLFASGQAWAVEQALDHHWPRLDFEARLPPMDAIKSLDVHGETGSGVGLDGEDIWACMAAAVDERSIGDTAFRVDALSTARLYGEYDDWDKDGRGDAKGLVQVLFDVCLYMGDTMGHDALCRHCGYRQYGPSCYDLVKCGRAHLLEHAIRAGAAVESLVWDAAARSKDTACLECLLALGAEKVLPLPKVAQNAVQPPWIKVAVRNGRVGALALCDRYGIAFDHVDAFLTAAKNRQPRVMTWLWHRQTVQKCESHLDLGLAVDATIDRHPFRQTLSLEWICAEGRWAPHPDALVSLVDRACLAGAFECALFFVQRWTRVFFDRAGVHGLVRIFAMMTRRRCDLAVVMRFLDTMDRHAASLGLDKLNLWPALFDVSVLDYDRAWHKWVRIACAVANGEMPSARDVNAISARREEPCPCAFGPDWRHQSRNDHHELKPDDPCTPDQADMLAPLACWVRPEPVDLQFPPHPREIAGGRTWHADEYRAIYDFLKARGLVAADSEASS
ncbi:F-box incomplete domain containing protein [Pandoravirus neocaledonia]|uniref:F-box incomplete domain containing protein n=1 Tax=Pandoravirus neocaledonia TaxID=2107708 RepID=A0A2U7UCY2_9VIRU|nr:F-box incomplete domain containing protein [Pandoravirus neocaledonia]AVK76296.1 F-box incomplete domain containing protein [Pandoravirus neocaledonia]